MDTQTDSGNRSEHWQKSKRLMIITLLVWLFFSFAIHGFVGLFNDYTIPILNFKFGYYLAGQGSLIAFVIMIFVFVKKQNAIDVEFDVDEKE